MKKQTSQEKYNENPLDLYSKYTEDSVEYISRQDEMEALSELGLNFKNQDTESW